MFSSTIIPTIGRSTLSRAVCSVLDQDSDQNDIEVIVVNDSGKPLPQEEWQSSPRVRIVHTNRRNRSVARNVGASVAQGEYLHFLDDDDWMLPGAFNEFRNLVQNNDQAAWIYGAFRFVDNIGKTVFELYPDEAGNCFIQLLAWEWLPLQASLIKSEPFFQIGGFASLSSLLGGFEDVHLSREITRHYDVSRLDRLVTCIRIGTEGSTTNYTNMFMQNHQSREKALNHSGAFTRMRDSANSSLTRPGYWYGKIVYYYLASAKWHLDQKRLFAAMSRTLFAFAGFLTAGRYLLISDFWRGVFKPHYPRMGRALQEAGTDHLYENVTR